MGPPGLSLAEMMRLGEPGEYVIILLLAYTKVLLSMYQSDTIQLPKVILKLQKIK